MICGKLSYHEQLACKRDIKTNLTETLPPRNMPHFPSSLGLLTLCLPCLLTRQSIAFCSSKIDNASLENCKIHSAKCFLPYFVDLLAWCKLLAVSRNPREMASLFSAAIWSLWRHEIAKSWTTEACCRCLLSSCRLLKLNFSCIRDLDFPCSVLIHDTVNFVNASNSFLSTCHNV